MATVKEEAEVIEPKEYPTVVDLELIDISLDVTVKNEEINGKEVQNKYIKVDEKEYRIPDSVLLQLKAQLKENPKIKNFKVTKEGTGLKTKYTVIVK